MIQLILHWFGDYVLQSDWMGVNKSKDTRICLCHCVIYTIPFLLLTQSPNALLFIFTTHFLIDRFSAARYLIWLRNHLNPTFTYERWHDCKMTGSYDVDSYQLVPLFTTARTRYITFWIYVIVDNGMHLTCNYFAISHL